MRCVPARDFNVAKAVAWRSAIHDDPPYQRESSVWSTDKQQLFIDSLLNGYDVPKIYLHDLRGQHPTLVYTVVDGRQRLSTIWRFLADELPLADDFRIEQANRPAIPADATDPQAGQRFSQLDRHWREVLRRTPLAVVLIQNATEQDIEDLFSRLNNGEPLTAAEKRNAMGGAIAELARELVRHPFFSDTLRLPNHRHAHLELATRFLLIEDGDPDGAGAIPDLRSSALDTFVRSRRRLPEPERTALGDRATATLDAAASTFLPADPLLARASMIPVIYLLTRSLAGSPDRLVAVRPFLDAFQRARLDALRRTDGRGDPALGEFTHLSQHGTNEARNVARRLEILRAAFDREDGPRAPEDQEATLAGMG